MSREQRSRPFALDLDWSRLDSLSDDERRQFSEWYAKYHGQGTLDLVKFMPFWAEYRPGALKRYRRYLESVATAPTGLPLGAYPLLWLHCYSALGSERGTLYQVIFAKEAGASREEVLDTLNLAFLQAGPLWMSATASGVDEYMARWTKEPDQPGGSRWPEGWTADPDAFASGLDFSSPDLAPQELEKLEAWHMRVHGHVPRYVRFMGKHSPVQLKLFRSRYESAVRTLPKQMVPLLVLHLSAIIGRQDGMRRAALEARAFGVTKPQVMQTLGWTVLYNGLAGLDAVAEALEDILDGWPS